MRGACLVVFALLAGCVSAVQTPTATPDPILSVRDGGPGSAPRGGEKRPMLSEYRLADALAGEPSVAVDTRDGTVYVLGVAGEAGANVVWRSHDNGRNWTFLGPVAKEYGTNDGDLSVGPDGAVWAATAWSRRANGQEGAWCVAVSRSLDWGDHWQTTANACPFEGWQDRPWIVAGEGETLLLHGCASTAAWCLERTIDNREWRTTVLPFPLGGVVSRPLLGPGGAVTIAFALAAPAGDLRYHGPWIARSASPGAAWAFEAVAHETIDGRFLQLASDGRREFLAWAVHDVEGPMRIRTSVRADNWSAPVTVSGNRTAAMPWAAGRAGGLSVAWLSADARAHPHDVPASQSWTVSIWDNGTSLETGLEAHRGPLCGGYSLVRVCGRSMLGDFISAARAPDGSTWVAFANDTENATGFNAASVRVARWAGPAPP